MAESRWRVGLLSVALVATVGVGLQVDRDPEPVPLFNYGGSLGVQENPVLTAQWALNDGGGMVTAADWLVSRQQPDGSWRYWFDYDLAGHRASLEAGWPSAMAQGRALSVLARAYDMTGDDEYRTAARRAFRFLMVPTSEGGTRTDLDGGLWFEEYPTTPPSYVLNGFMFTLEGLWDARDLVPGAAAVYAEGAATLEQHIGRWDDDGRVAYDLLHEAVGGEAWHDDSYDQIHLDLLDDMLARRPSAELARWRGRWFGAAA